MTDEIKDLQAQVSRLEVVRRADEKSMEIIHAESRKLRALVWLATSAGPDSMQAGVAAVLKDSVQTIYSASAPDVGRG